MSCLFKEVHTGCWYIPMTLQKVERDFPPLASNLTHRDNDRMNLK